MSCNQTTQPPACIPEDGFRPQPPGMCPPVAGYQPQVLSENINCATERLLGPSNNYLCDQGKIAQQKVLNQKYAGGVRCDRSRPGYNPDCAVPLWSRNRQGYKGAVPYTGPYDKNAPYHYAESPYYMDNDDPRKFFMSGYTGFVPMTQAVIGNVFPQTTNKGLRKFTDMRCNVKQNFCKPVIVKTKNLDFDPPVDQLQQCSKEPLRTINIADVGIEYDPTIQLGCGSGMGGGSFSYSIADATYGESSAPLSSDAGRPAGQGLDGARRKMKMFRRKDPHPIYRTEEGLLPTYGGHVPNQQFRFGGTFGRETLNARNLNKRRG